ncbi:hypothetical protein ANN_07607, partial [Periplaneta americana]
LREEQRLRVFENKVLRKIFGAKRDEVTGEWRKLYNTELCALYSAPDIIRNIKSRRLRWAGHVARMGEPRNAYRVLVGRPEGKRPLGRPRRRWEDNIKVDLRGVGYDDRKWINLAQNRGQWRAYVRAAVNLPTLNPRRDPTVNQRDGNRTVPVQDCKVDVCLCLQSKMVDHVSSSVTILARIAGNEAADAAARAGALDGSLVYWRERWQDIRNYLKYKIWWQWEGEWSAQEGNRLRNIKNTVRVWDSSTRASRHEEVLLTRLRIGHCHLTHGHLLRGEPQPECDMCHVPLTVEHFLLRCRKYDYARRQYGIRPTLRDAVGNDFNCANAVLRFLSNTGLDKIGVVWIPGHVGIAGNEAADAAARAGALDGSLVYWRERWQDIRNYLKYKIWWQWEGEWSAQEGNRLRNIKNTVRVWDSSTRASRHEEVLLTRLRIGHCHLTHGHLLRGEPQPECDMCHVPLTVEHFYCVAGNMTMHGGNMEFGRHYVTLLEMILIVQMQF